MAHEQGLRRMPICTVNLVLSWLPDYELLSVPRNLERAVDWCGVVGVDLSEMGIDPTCVLYLLDTDELRRIGTLPEGSLGLLAVGTDEVFSVKSPPFDPSLLDRLIVVRDPGMKNFCSRLQSLVQSKLFAFKRLELESEAIISRGGSAQDLVDLFEPLFDNWINISDATYNLIAYTRHIDPPDPLSQSLLEHGCHLPSAVDTAHRRGIFNEWKKQEGVRAFEADETVGHPYITAVLKVGDVYYGHIVAVLNNTPYSPGIHDLFAAFASYVNGLFDHTSKLRANGLAPYQHFIELLLSGEEVNAMYVESQVEILGIPAEGYFHMAAIDYFGGECSTQPLHLVSMLKSSIPDALPLIYRGSILVLFHSREAEPGRERDLFQKLDAFCERYSCTALVSGLCRQIADIHHLYQQTQVVRRYQGVVRECFAISGEEVRLYYFHDAFSFYCCDLGRKNDAFLARCLENTPLDRIAEADHSHDVNDVKLLYCFLRLERKATPTAELLHMHRNNVLYRIGNIEKRFALDLSSFGVRQSLLNYYRLKMLHSAEFRKLLE